MKMTISSDGKRTEKCLPASQVFKAKVLLILFLYSCVVYAEPLAAENEQRQWSGKVIAVKDGDTLGIMKEGRQINVRLYGIDCPEKFQPFGRKAKEFASNLVFDKTVKVIEHGGDRYGRTIGEVFLPDHRSLNHELVKAGFAWWYIRYAPKDAELAEIERQAREKRLGLWSDPRPIPPWEYRKMQRMPEKTKRSGKVMK